MSGALSIVWQRQPPGVPRLDRSNPLTRGLVFCAVPWANTAIDLVTGVAGTRTGALYVQLRAPAGGFSRAGQSALTIGATGTTTDQIVWPVSTTLRGGTAVQQGTLLCLGGIAEQVATRMYQFGSTMDVSGNGMSLRVSTGLTGIAGGISRGTSASTSVATSTASLLGSSPGLQTHFFGYSYEANGATGTWLGARTGEDWTGGTVFGTGNTSRKAMLFTSYDAATYNTKTTFQSLFLIYDRRLSLAEYQALYDNPWQLFQPLPGPIILVPSVAAGGTDASVTLSGVSASPGVGSATAAGAAVVALIGTAASPVVGIVTATAGANATVALDGAAAAPSVGSVTALGGALATLTGLAAAPAVGTVVAVAGGNALISLTGVSAAPGVGTVTAAGGAVRALLGVGATPGVGVVTVNLAGNAQVLLSGVSAAALVGTVSSIAGASVSIFGVGALPGVGVITVSLIEPGVADGSAAPRIVFAPARLDRVDAGEGRRIVSVN